MVAERGSSQIVDALIPPVMEEIIEAVRRIPHERIGQRIVEETVKDVPEVDQGQPTFEGQPKDFRADTSCAGAVVVSDSESLAATLASEVASKDSCVHVTADQEVSAKTCAEELKTLACAKQAIGSEKYSLFQVSSFTGVHPMVDLKGFDAVQMMRHLSQKEHSAALSPDLGASVGEDPFLDVKAKEESRTGHCRRPHGGAKTGAGDSESTVQWTSHWSSILTRRRNRSQMFLRFSVSIEW